MLQTKLSYLSNRRFFISLFTGLVFLTISLIINSYAVDFATETASNSVTDVILSNTRVYNVEGFFVYGAVLFVVIIAIVCLVKFERTPFVLKSIALFTVIRAFFVSLTHISPFPQHLILTPNVFTLQFPSIFTGDDLFFSGHTGLPFLLALIFWEHKYLRTLFLGFSIIFAFVVLLGHLHYSIDVAAAFFITYTIFVIAKKFFKEDWNHLRQT